MHLSNFAKIVQVEGTEKSMAQIPRWSSHPNSPYLVIAIYPYENSSKNESSIHIEIENLMQRIIKFLTNYYRSDKIMEHLTWRENLLYFLCSDFDDIPMMKSVCVFFPMYKFLLKMKVREKRRGKEKVTIKDKQHYLRSCTYCTSCCCRCRVIQLLYNVYLRVWWVHSFSL